MFELTIKMFLVLLDIVFTAVLIGAAIIALSFILYIVICAIKAMIKASKDDPDPDTYYR